jgi:hypothetical protein
MRFPRSEGFFESRPEKGMTKTCFRGGCSKAYAGASVAEYGTIGGASERNQVVLRTPKLDPGVGPAPSDLRLPGGRGRRKRRSPNTSASAGQRHIFSDITACSALVPGSAESTSSSRLALRSTPSARQIRDAPRLLRLRYGGAETLWPHTCVPQGSRARSCKSPVLRVALVFSADDSLSFRFPRTCACARCFDVLAVCGYVLLRFARFFSFMCFAE